jgi:predicted MFS family arabinose efflux permease
MAEGNSAIADEGTPARGAGVLTPGKVTFVLAMLFIVNVFNFIDRQLPFILVDSIKKDLNLSDTQIGLMGGLAFAVVYSTMALPLARLADRWSAKWVMVGSLSVWCALTAAGGAAQNFYQLVASRIGVSAGEAGSTPAAHSMITSMVPEARRAFAIGVFSFGVSVGGMLGLILGGWLHDIASWRVAMVAIGLPGLLFAVIFALTVPDVRSAHSGQPAGSFVDAARELFAYKSYRHLCFAITVYGIGVYANYTFHAPFFLRTYGVSAAEGGLWLGLSNGFIGLIGALGGGYLADRIARLNPGKVLLLPAFGFAIAAPLHIASLMAPTPLLNILIGLPAGLASPFYLAPSFSTAQRLASPRSRATASAILLFGLSLIGASVGPFLAGWASDLLEPRFGNHTLRFVLCGSAFFNVWAVIHLLIATKSLTGDLKRSQALQAATA